MLCLFFAWREARGRLGGLVARRRSSENESRSVEKRALCAPFFPSAQRAGLSSLFSRSRELSWCLDRRTLAHGGDVRGRALSHWSEEFSFALFQTGSPWVLQAEKPLSKSEKKKRIKTKRKRENVQGFGFWGFGARGWREGPARGGLLKGMEEGGSEGSEGEVEGVGLWIASERGHYLTRSKEQQNESNEHDSSRDDH